MTIQLTVLSDFATIIDGVELITLKRRDSATTIAIGAAWRFSSRTTEAEAAGGHVAQRDVVWQFAWDALVALPRLGDTLIDAAGDAFVILAVDTFVSGTRLRCTTRNLSLVYELNDHVEVQQAVWEDSGDGPEIVGWTTLRTALPARIQPHQVDVDHSPSPPTATETYRIILGEQIDLPADVRFVDVDGEVYELVQVTQAERIDALPVALVRTPTPS